MDLYRKEIQGFFGIPVDNLRASPFLLGYIKENVADYRNAVIVAKNAGVMNKATSYAERLRLSIAVSSCCFFGFISFIMLSETWRKITSNQTQF